MAAERFFSPFLLKRPRRVRTRGDPDGGFQSAVAEDSGLVGAIRRWTAARHGKAEIESAAKLFKTRTRKGYERFLKARRKTTTINQTEREGQ